ncbi:MAG: quinoprotein relay system zinc metallohydrolase 2, partial [Pseudomonadota bacterium]|nr:quinoprotein relay system zinc metallohydrolase 2 [Pseudomonadota bacterium]
MLGLSLSAASAEPAIEPLPVREIAEGVFVYQAPYALAAPVNDGAIANIGFVVGHEAVAVIDTGGSFRAGARLKAAIRARTPLPIRYVINTHMHPDHVLGNAAFRDEGSDFVAHHKLAPALAARADTYLAAAHRLIGEEAFAGTAVVLPQTPVAAKLVLDLGDRTLELEAHPTAHTDNDLTVLDTRTGTWFLGDLLFVGHVPALDGSLRGWLELMREARERPAARVVPGHGPTSAPWPQALEPQERYLSRLRADVRRLLDEGRTMGEAAARAGLAERDAWDLFEEFNARNATAAYHELEWE